MEKTRVTAAALLLLGALAFGQQSQDDRKRQPPQGRNFANMDMKQFAEMNATRTQQQLEMSEKQTEATTPMLSELFLLQMEISLRQVLVGENTGDELNDEEVAERQKRDAEVIEDLEEILSEHQMAVYLEMRQMQNRFGGGLGGGRGRQQQENTGSGAQSL